MCNGVRLSYAIYSDVKLYSKCIHYNYNGQLQSVTSYVNGAKEGDCRVIHYDDNPRIVVRGQYTNGNLVWVGRSKLSSIKIHLIRTVILLSLLIFYTLCTCLYFTVLSYYSSK